MQWDRHDMSSQAYQGGGRGLPQTTLDSLSDIVFLQIYISEKSLHVCLASHDASLNPEFHSIISKTTVFLE